MALSDKNKLLFNKIPSNGMELEQLMEQEKYGFQ
jgi:hypothetical protein